MDLKKIKIAFLKTVKGFKQMMPIILSVIMLVSLSIALIPSTFYKIIFTGNNIVDPLIGGALGSISAGNPVVSYIIGGELIAQNVSLTAVIVFMITWVTVGIVQLPAESLMLGKRFAITRNIVSFLMALLISFLIIFTLSFV